MRFYGVKKIVIIMAGDLMEIVQKIRQLIQKNLKGLDDVSFGDDDDIFALGFVNSMFAMKLVNFIEDEFDIVVENDDLDLANFRSVTKIVNFINKKKAA
jgi:methoxymalonate biosynthesis acyl carrier protein